MTGLTLPGFLGDTRAACAAPGTDPNLWHTPTDTARTTAKAICAHCPLNTACLAYALDHPAERGIWGGTTAGDRRRLRAQTRGDTSPICGTEAGLRAHRADNETCPECEIAAAARLEARRRAALSREHAKGGTVTGHQIHYRLGESSCEACLRAVRVDGMTRRAKKRAARAQQARPAVGGRVLAAAS